MEMHFDDPNHQVFVQVADQIIILDTKTWVEITSIENAYCYHAETDRFFVYSYLTSAECRVGYIHHYTVDELIEKAYNYLGGQEVTEELKNKYGI